MFFPGRSSPSQTSQNDADEHRHRERHRCNKRHACLPDGFELKWKKSCFFFFECVWDLELSAWNFGCGAVAFEYRGNPISQLAEKSRQKAVSIRCKQLGLIGLGASQSVSSNRIMFF